MNVSIAEISLGRNPKFISARIFDANPKVNAKAGILKKERGVRRGKGSGCGGPARIPEKGEAR